MNAQWALETQGNPLLAFQDFISTVWEKASLDGMVVHTNGGFSALTQPRLIEEPKALNKVNPFKPLMTKNAATLIPDLIEDNPEGRYGALLRPCELRALTEMYKIDAFEIQNLLTISVDCLGTLPADEYEWRAERKSASGDLAQDALQFARQGGILAYRYRSACQTCTAPQAKGADVNIYVFGLPVRQHMLVEVGDPETDKQLEFAGITSGPAEPALVEQHARVVARLEENHQRTMERLRVNLAEFLPADVEALAEQLADCGSCQECVDACPICFIQQPQRNAQARYSKESLIQWLVSCAGCGMCEQACSKHLPLSTIFGHIREQLAEEFDYLPGRSFDDPLPS
jgi:formate dehydrogenase subunit beta